MTDCISVTRKGEPGFVYPGSPEHRQFLTASKVASVLGVSRFQSAWSLWQYMKGNVPPSDGDTPSIFLVGHAFEYALAELWRLKNPGWKLSRDEVQYTNDLGFPAMATLDRRASRGRARRIVEMKIARNLEDWGDPALSGEIPADYAAQLTFQMMVSGLKNTADLIVMGPFFQETIYRVDYDETVAGWIQAECRYFWDSLASDTPPALDDSVSTYRTVKDMHPEITVGLEREVPEELYLQLQKSVAKSKDADAVCRGYKSQVLDIVGDAQHGVVNGEKVLTRRPGARGTVNLIVR